ncbi:uncharacterized protein isoform X2 [Musca autumnalis]|uniref:uncharacterized protein isoform X2 n=1 Tax=Musca autumnalis TaxID=221902 RepID=UPI003CEBC57E
MNRRNISKEIYRWYLRLTGLTSSSPNSQLERILIAYTAILLIIGLWISYTFTLSQILNNEWITISITILLWQFLTSAILSKLTSSPVKSPLLDDFILQIRQNPIKFTAYDFYELNSETLTKVSVIVFDLMLFLLQIFSLTNIA